ncbi:hypothetical protein E5845_11680 [Pseudomonas fluorescens]|uniref:hypothetical protein n=1 Tax=Pseudomonas rhodesiae TaxID=76760 RepID=UPI001093C7E5|nr:hypothetical protein [Pseudomonas rhodesiae]TGY18745.1 hypothetical protein E5845_11680 [Pseudomonas fluorescens]
MEALKNLPSGGFFSFCILSVGCSQMAPRQLIPMVDQKPLLLFAGNLRLDQIPNAAKLLSQQLKFQWGFSVAHSGI